MGVPLGSWGCLVLVLTAHILTSLLASAQVGSEITILVHMEPQIPKLGEDVTFFSGEMKNDTVSCVWYKGEKENLTYSEILIYYIQNHTIYFKAAYDKRQFVGRDCVLHLRNLRSDDRAIYAIHKKRPGITEKAHLASSYFMFVQAQRKPDFPLFIRPQYPVEGQNVSLIPHVPPNETTSCLWTKGENKTEILRYFPWNLTFEPLFAYHSGHLPMEDCILEIYNVSYLDMGIYGIIQTLPTKTIYGEGFLMVTRESTPKKKKALGAGIIAGISAGCLVGVLLVIGLVTYQTRGFHLRGTTTTEPATSSPTQEASTNKEGNQPGTNKQSQEAEGNKI